MYAKPFTYFSYLILSTYYVLGLAACFANEEMELRGFKQPAQDYVLSILGGQDLNLDLTSKPTFLLWHLASLLGGEQLEAYFI